MPSTPSPCAVLEDQESARHQPCPPSRIMASDNTSFILLDLPTERTWRRRQHLNAEPVWPPLITHDPQLSRRDTTQAALHAGAHAASLSATPRREIAAASKAAPRQTRHDSLCAEWSYQRSLARADAGALGSSSTPLTGTQKVSAWLHAFPLLPLQIQGLDSGQGCQRTAMPRQHKTERDAAVESNCVGRQERRALDAALACTGASAEFRARCAQKGLYLGGTSAPR
jgi:hypothetical protein